MKLNQIPYTRPDVGAACEKLAGYARALENAGSPEVAVQVIHQADGLARTLHDSATLASIRYTQDTRDPFYAAEQAFFAQATPAFYEKLSAFHRVMLASPHREALERLIPKVAFENAEMAAKTISPQVLDLLEAESKLELEYQQLVGAIMVEYDGQRLPMPKMAAYTESTDRTVRRAATAACGAAYAQKAAEFDRIFDGLVALRTEIAQKLGFDNFIQLGYLRMSRNGYGPDEVAAFRRQVKRELVPLVGRLRAEQAKRLGLEALKFYDAAVLRPEGNPRPVKTEEDLYAVGVGLYRDMHPETAAMIDKMDAMGAFDLYAREGKMAGGYCAYRDSEQLPFIFANFSGTAGDVEVFTHEGGHAFQIYLCRDHDLFSLTMTTFETAEVHSMGMEFLCWPYLDRFYGDQAEIAKVIHLIGALYFIPYGCLVDEFQHIVYANPQMSPEERNAAWAKLEREYFPDMDYDGLPFYAEGRRWQRQMHIYDTPFYYIDYCLAQVCALQFLEVMQNRGWDEAFKQYRAFTANGGRMSFVELLRQAGMKVPFEDGVLGGIIAVAEASTKI